MDFMNSRTNTEITYTVLEYNCNCSCTHSEIRGRGSKFQVEECGFSKAPTKPLNNQTPWQEGIRLCSI